MIRLFEFGSFWNIYFIGNLLQFVVEIVRNGTIDYTQLFLNCARESKFYAINMHFLGNSRFAKMHS